MNKFLILTIALALMLVLPNVSALGETKDVIAPTPTNPYGSVDLYNNWKIPFISSKLATYTLLENQDSVIDAWASGTVTLYIESTLFSNLEFLNRQNKNTMANFKFYYYTTEEYTTTDYTYKEVCGEIAKNGTKSCSQEVVDKKDIINTREVLTEYKGETLQPGTYKWEIKGKKPGPNYALDWIAEAQGVKLDNWAWWNSTFMYKKQITLTGAIPANYSTYISVAKSANMKADYSDLRFIDNTESTELPYWIESTNATTALVWVKVQSNASIYMYYGYTGATSKSNAEDAFLIYTIASNYNTTNFTTSSGWSQAGNSATPTISGTTLTGGCSGGSCWLAKGGIYWTKYNITNLNQYVIELKDYTSASYYGFWSLGSGITSTALQATAGWWAESRVPASLWGGGIVGQAEVQAGTSASNTLYNVTEVLNATGSYLYTGASFGARTTLQRTKVAVPASFGDYKMGFGAGVGASDTWSFKEVRLRAYLNPVPTATFGSETESNTLAVTLSVPADNYNIPTNSVIFNCSGIDETGILNLTLIIDGVDNNTVTGGASQKNISLQVTRTLSEGSHNWTCRGSDGTGTGDPYTASIRNIYIDTIAPRINILYPTSNLEIQTFNPTINVSLNVSITEAGYFTNCWYYNGSANTSITCRNNATVNLTGGFTIFAYYANDSVGNIGSNSTTFLVNYLRPLVNYSLAGVEGETTTIYFNITANNITQANATLNYNNTNYAMDILSYDGLTGAFYKTITLPLVNADTVKQFNVSYYVNGINYNTVYYNQTVYNIPSLNVSAGLCVGTPIYWFSLQDEENLSTVSGEFEYNFYYGLSNSSMVRTYGKISGASNFSICANTTISPNWTIGSGEVFYSSTGYVDRRYYIFDGTVVTSATNLTLYDLLSTSQTSFKLEIEDTSLNPYENVYSRLLRWYPDLNEYKIVDMGKTDDTGSTVIHVRTEDVDYRIGAYYTNGTLIYLAQPIRMVCLASPCTYTLKISPRDIDYTSFLNIVYTFTYNETTGIWEFVYSDTTGKTSTMNLTVYRVTSTTIYPVCSDTITGAVGSLTCNTSIYTTGELRAEVQRSASPPVVIVQKVVHLFTTAFKGSSFGLWLSLLLGLPVVFLFALISPIGALLGGIIALIPALYFGSINIGIVGGLAILAGIVAHFLKRVS